MRPQKLCLRLKSVQQHRFIYFEALVVYLVMILRALGDPFLSCSLTMEFITSCNTI